MVTLSLAHLLLARPAFRVLSLTDNYTSRGWFSVLAIMSCCDQRCGLITGAVIGVLIAALGGILIPVGDMVIEKTVFKETVLENGTLAFDTWTSVGTPIYRQFWIFDVQNAEDVQRTGEKPVLVQKGPYTYKIRFIPKRDITFNGNNTVSFLLPAGATFEPSMSVGTEEDVFTSLNLAVAGLYGMLGHKMANILIERVKANLFQNRTVKELLWGYKDPVLNTMIGVFYPYNDTTDGPYTVFTGYDDIQKVATIERWQGESSLKYWNNSYCDMINGTGKLITFNLKWLLFPPLPGQERDPILLFFRYLQILSDKHVDVELSRVHSSLKS
ncbi:hypothetical protein DNTS_033215 [Danionella cerebrum]|uniref:Platelet glycoprotein 4 n=1 Tax=Danionella cerebrum TaxID=2873325 RepID=A0A553RCW5_9TELE|nr:hypothetical protein DNTS_033215 [Danionella translucida]